MTDIRLKQYLSLEAVTMDWLLLDTGALDEREELATAARVALGTDKLADPNDVLPDPDSTDRRGWWGDFEADLIWGGWPIGTKNWLLSRAKITDAFAEEGSTLSRAENYTREALQPFVDKRIATSLDAVATRNDVQTIEVDAKIYRGPLAEIDLRYQQLWQEEPIYEAPPQINILIVVPPGVLLLTPYMPLRRETILISPPGNVALSGTVPTRFVGLTPTRRDLALSPTAPTVRTLDHGMIVPQGNLKADPKIVGRGQPSRNLFLSPTAPIVRWGLLAARRDLALSTTAPVVRSLDHGMIPAAGNLTITSTPLFRYTPATNVAISSMPPIVIRTTG